MKTIEMSGVDHTTDLDNIAVQLEFALACLTFVASRASKPEYHDEIAAQEIRLNLILSRLELILSFVELQRPYRFRARL